LKMGQAWDELVGLFVNSPLEVLCSHARDPHLDFNKLVQQYLQGTAVANGGEARQKDSPQRHRGTKKKPGDDFSNGPIGGGSDSLRR
jgi:hypothetical protein